MICRKCGNLLDDNARFCRSCGARVEAEPQRGYTQPRTEYTQEHSYSYQEQAYAAPAEKPQVRFVDAVKLYFARYTDFQGRSRRSEYWWIMLFNVLASAVLSIVVGITGLDVLSTLWTLVTLIPGIALAVRRLHDVGKSAWWYLFLLLPLVGSIILIIQFCKDSDPNPNQWGASPKYQ